ncbi:MAG TPA: cysteine desulfurase family protein [Patescibacteria group bacterium]|nr:cysteine desulfurase family protein [Patescibacteria group bacterium]
MIYLDNSATTKIDKRVLDAMLPWLRDHYGNASSSYALGRKARVAVEDAREEIASFLKAHPAEIYFTSGGTESNNTILKSACLSTKIADTVLYSAVEHHAVLEPAIELARMGFKAIEIPVNSIGVADMAELQKNNRRNTLVSIMHANNETGVVNPLHLIREVADFAYLHTDAVQTFGKIPLDTQALKLDFASFSAHKIHGPKGVGAMFIRRGIDFKAHQHGGAQERNRRAGTEPVALIVGMQVAARLAHQNMEKRARKMQKRITLLKTLVKDIPDIRINTPEQVALPNILNLSFTDANRLDGQAILQMLDMRGIAVSNGSACVSGTPQPSHVLKALGLPDAEANAAVRFSVSKDTTEEEIREAAGALREILGEMRG